MKPCRFSVPHSPVHPFVNDWLVNTNGNLYWGSRGKLLRYPIPSWPYLRGEGKWLVDIGCSWGRWSIAAARADYQVVGADVHLDAVAAASSVARQLGVRAGFVCGAAECLPFRDSSIDVACSYSVLQHLERSKVFRILLEISRVLKPGGACFLQLPNRFGLVSLLRQARRGFRDGKPSTFQMRYWSRPQIRAALADAGLRLVGFRADGFLSQNPQLADLDLLSTWGKLVVTISAAGCRAASAFPALIRVADSLWLEAQAPMSSVR